MYAGSLESTKEAKELLEVIAESNSSFLSSCSDHRDQLFCLFELKKLPWP